MQHLNYCRQALKDLNDGRGCLPPELIEKQNSTEMQGAFYEMRDLLLNGIKIFLPDGGKIFDDKSLKAIAETEELSLPFKRIALEYHYPRNESSDDDFHFSKRIILASEKDEFIDVGLVSYCDDKKAWFVFPYISLPRRDFFIRDGGKIHFGLSSYFEETVFQDYGEEVWVLYDVLNALACRNVHIEKSPAKSTKQGKKVKTALPFDDYHFLTVDVPGKAGVRGDGLGGSHRSPREHLRRGHIRRLDSGPIWVNACVVNAGIGSKVGKSYLLRKSE